MNVVSIIENWKFRLSLLYTVIIGIWRTLTKFLMDQGFFLRFHASDQNSVDGLHRGWNTAHLLRLSKKAMIRIPINQPVFHGSCHWWVLIIAHVESTPLKINNFWTSKSPNWNPEHHLPSTSIVGFKSREFSRENCGDFFSSCHRCQDHVGVYETCIRLVWPW